MPTKIATVEYQSAENNKSHPFLVVFSPTLTRQKRGGELISIF